MNFEKKPIGFIQTYQACKVGDGWWKGESEGTWGIDQFIGEKDFLGKGLGSKFISQFTNDLLTKDKVDRIITDPSPNNHRAIRSYEKAGFLRLEEIETPDGAALLMEKKY